MNKELQEKQQILKQQLNTLLTTKNTLVLSTINQQNLCDIGLIPFLYFENYFYILISELAAHTRNLQQNPHAALLIHLGDESSNNPFTDQRVSFAVSTSVVDQVDLKASILDKMQHKLGKTIALISGLKDFSLMRLKAKSGTLVVGFGAAYVIDVDSFELIHIDENKVKEIKRESDFKLNS
ncbi:MAG: pyridoxamine 5'-phosphate oxidase family protein [Saccharospirillaceae bacterium]|nr:pyridoxamine 5'-phosphate oxidase family protein [Pseudomonadales bacterium]NRB77104.1 pyridoxamine 5'-phosphate oxidase family protein [Saccharospirillaceae bacterium]